MVGGKDWHLLCLWTDVTVARSMVWTVCDGVDFVEQPCWLSTVQDVTLTNPAARPSGFGDVSLRRTRSERKLLMNQLIEKNFWLLLSLFLTCCEKILDGYESIAQRGSCHSEPLSQILRTNLHLNTRQLLKEYESAGKYQWVIIRKTCLCFCSDIVLSSEPYGDQEGGVAGFLHRSLHYDNLLNYVTLSRLSECQIIWKRAWSGFSFSIKIWIWYHG